MKVAVVYQYYQGHQAPGHSLVFELTQHLAGQGHEVTVVSGETGYMQADQAVLPWYRRLLRRERDGAVKVIRTFTYTQLNRSYSGRLLSFISFSLSAPLGLLGMRRPDVVLASSPPIFPMFSTWLVCKLRGIPLVLEVRDLWPESAVQMGILRNRLLISVMSWMERLLYNQAVRIVALTTGIRDDIVARGWPAEKLQVVTCGVDRDMLFTDLPAGQRIRRQLGWQDCHIVLYLGAMGEANNLDVVLDAARQSHGKPVRYLLIGDGMRKPCIQARAQALGLDNVLILPPIPKDQARAYINAADLCVVTLLDIPLFRGAIPTKLLDYMACARPVLCGVAGEAGQIVKAAGAGLNFSANDGQHLAELIEQLRHDPEKCLLMGRRGQAYVREHFDSAVNRRAMEQLLLDSCRVALKAPASG
ncbi:glycosyltransferase family 4 protein [Pseudomonas sp. 21LCFQ02]|uniref:glycosyltransferase family 4 protein n=1 Tax=Pseudomonas sp. 21LCFQ02 TaxID=2957505 RepID=UPI00209A765A|nr:glycosyltransferase family 4 protein [Pseudomonas sp. 21LCFQ02]MCO8166584.1 glycosyltransferase family 4 protein [Pseudomonas sp. 21LCFQ02]